MRSIMRSMTVFRLFPRALPDNAAMGKLFATLRSKKGKVCSYWDGQSVKERQARPQMRPFAATMREVFLGPDLEQWTDE